MTRFTMITPLDPRHRRLRAWTAVFIAGLAFSGLTAIPVQTEFEWVARWLGADYSASGALPAFVEALRVGVIWLGYDAAWVDAVPTMLMKPLSGSGARAMMVETMQVHGADSFAGRLASIVQGSTETTFYVLAVYFEPAPQEVTKPIVGVKVRRE